MNGAILGDYGISYEQGLKRCLDSEEIYGLVLAAFLNDTAFGRAKTAYQCGDYGALFDCAHELKGATANAAMTELTEAAGALVERLRDKTSDPENIAPLFGALEKEYIRAKDGVTLALSE